MTPASTPDSQTPGNAQDLPQAPKEPGQPPPSHRVLLVNDDPEEQARIQNILEEMGIQCVAVPTPQEGIKALENAKKTFSMILTDQNKTGVRGTHLLSFAREKTPKTIRFLITGYSEMDTIIDAVNKGAVQHYILKPFENEAMARAVSKGLALFDTHQDNSRLFSLAKKQNAKLYDLNCELMESSKQHQKDKNTLDQELAKLQQALDQVSTPQVIDPEKTITQIAAHLGGETTAAQAVLETLEVTIYTALYGAFTDLALRNGIEMPGLGSGGDDD